MMKLITREIETAQKIWLEKAWALTPGTRIGDQTQLGATQTWQMTQLLQFIKRRQHRVLDEITYLQHQEHSGRPLVNTHVSCPQQELENTMGQPGFESTSACSQSPSFFHGFSVIILRSALLLLLNMLNIIKRFRNSKTR